MELAHLNPTKPRAQSINYIHLKVRVMSLIKEAKKH